MANGSLARRYGRALISLGVEDNLVDEYGAALKEFQAVLQDGDELLLSALTNPSIPQNQRTNTLLAVLNKMQLPTHPKHFIQLLMDKNRMANFIDIQQSYAEMADEIAGRLHATVTTANTIKASEQDDIRNSLAANAGVAPEKLLVAFNVNPDIIGGVIAHVGDTVYDASVRARVQDIQTALLS